MEKTAIFFRKKKKELKMNIDEEKNYKKPNMKSRLKISMGIKKTINTINTPGI